MFVSSTGILPVIWGAFSLFGWGSGHKFGWYCSCNLCSASRFFVGAFLGVNDHFGCLVLRRQPLTRDRVGHNAKTGSPMSKTQERNLKKRVKSEKSFRQILARWPQRSSPPPGGTSAYALPPTLLASRVASLWPSFVPLHYLTESSPPPPHQVFSSLDCRKSTQTLFF